MWVTFGSSGLCAYNMSNVLNIVQIPSLCYSDGGNLSPAVNILNATKGTLYQVVVSPDDSLLFVSVRSTGVCIITVNKSKRCH
jgi:hypothetical protein